MAFMDDAQFVISQIRHSCVTSDDTGKLLHCKIENTCYQHECFSNSWNKCKQKKDLILSVKLDDFPSAAHL